MGAAVLLKQFESILGGPLDLDMRTLPRSTPIRKPIPASSWYLRN